MNGIRRVALPALPALVAAAALLGLAGGAYAGGAADQALAVAVDGPGTISGNGISCREGNGDCVELYADGMSVTLTATPDSGATFSGWGGDCSAETGTACTLAMNSAKAVTATFASGSGGGDPTLVVDGTGTGKVAGTGIDCGNGGTDCSESYAPGTPVTLTETPGAGASFAGWGGACSGLSTTCTVTMGSSQSVTAAFTSGSTETLTVTVNGNGRVAGPGISCGNGSTDCSEAYGVGTSVTLTETPNTGATFSGWGGACTDTGRVCNLVMDEPFAVSASFSRPGSRLTGTFAVHSLGRPLVRRTSAGWAVTLRFFTSRSAAALLRLSLNGRFVNAFALSPRAGSALVGPFTVARPGTYRFRLTLSDRRGSTAEIVWNLCLASACAGFTLR